MLNLLEKHLLSLDKDDKFDFVIFRFFDLNGRRKEISYSAEYISESLLKNDALVIADDKISSNQKIYLKPDVRTIFPDFACRSIIVHCYIVHKPHAGIGMYYNVEDDPRYIAQKAENYLFSSFNINNIAFFIELDFLITINPDLEDKFYNDIKSSFEASNIHLISYRTIKDCQKRLGFFSKSILLTADALEKVKYILYKVSTYHGLTMRFEDERKQNLYFHVHHIVYQHNRSIFKINNFFAPIEELEQYAASVLYDYNKIMKIIGDYKGEHIAKAQFYYASDLPCFSNNCKLLAGDLYLSVDFPIKNTNTYLMLTCLVIFGIDGICDKVDPTELGITQEDFSMVYKMNTALKSERTNATPLINEVMSEDILQSIYYNYR